MAVPKPLLPWTVIVALVSTGGANQITFVTVPPKTRLVTMFPETDDAFITDRGAEGTVPDDIHRYPVTADGHNEAHINGWGSDGPIIRIGSATTSTKVRFLCQ